MSSGKSIKIKDVELFQAGTHTPFQGEALHFTNQDLQSIAETAVGGEIRIGHDDDNPENYGTITKAFIKGRSLYADFEVSAVFAKALNELKNRSIGLVRESGKWLFDHIAFLGDTAPALQLQEITFSKVEASDRFVFNNPTQEIDMDKEAQFAADQATHVAAVANFEKEKAQVAADKVQFEKDQATFAADKAALADARAEFAKAQDGVFVDKLIGDNLLLEKDKDATLTFMASLDTDQKATYQAQLSNVAPVVDTGEVSGDDGAEFMAGKAPAGVDKDSHKIDMAAKEYMKANPKVSYQQAVSKVANTGGEA